jgi:PAS domain S-box-containing protein
MSNNNDFTNDPLLMTEIMKNISQGVYLIRTDNFTIIYANRKFEEMFGYNSGEIIGKNVDVVNAPTDKTPEETRKAIVNVLNKDKEWHGEIENIKKDGTHFWCNASASLFNYSDFGQVILAVHNDITEQKLRLEKATENEIMLNSIFDNALLGIALVSPTGKWLRINKAVCEMLGYNKDELLTMDFKDITYPDEIERDLGMLKKMLAGEMNEYKVDKRYITKDGQTIWVNMQSSLIRNKENQPLYFVTAIENIDQRKKIEEEIRQSEQRFKIIFNSNTGCICLNKLSDGKFLDVNDAFLHMIGYNREEVIGKTSADLNLWANPEQRADIIKQMNEKGNSIGIETKWHNKSGELIDVIVDTVVIDIGGEKDYLGLIVDITKRKKAEVELQEKIADLGKMNNFMVGRELQMIELKNEITNLKQEIQELSNK